jgi:uncharacterized protein (DUF302 family)
VQAIETTIDRPFSQAEAVVRQALAEQGFGVLTEIDVAATLRAKLGVDRAALKILGACNPSLANRAIERNSSVALLLPCNVVLEDAGAGRTRVAIAHPRALFGALGAPDGDRLDAVSSETADAMERVVTAVGR